MARTVVSMTPGPGSSSKSGTKSVTSSTSSVSVADKSAKSVMKSLPPKKRAKLAKKLRMEEITETKVKTAPKNRKNVVENLKESSDKAKEVIKNVKKNSGGVKAKYLSMISECIFKLQNKFGSSRPVILNQLKLDFSDVIGVNEAAINQNLKLALKLGLDTGVLKMAKETGKGSGSFKLSEEEVKRVKLKKKSSSGDKVKKDRRLSASIKDFFSAIPEAATPQAKESKIDDSEILKEEVIKTPESFVLLERIPIDEPLVTVSDDYEEESIRTPESFVLLENISTEEPFFGSPSLRRSRNRGAH